MKSGFTRATGELGKAGAVPPLSVDEKRKALKNKLISAQVDMLASVQWRY